MVCVNNSSNFPQVSRYCCGLDSSSKVIVSFYPNVIPDFEIWFPIRAVKTTTLLGLIILPRPNLGYFLAQWAYLDLWKPTQLQM